MQSIARRFSSSGLLTVLGAGLLDGVNPCAFATVISFVSYLAFVGRKDRQALLAGLAFTAAVFVAYLRIGLGVLAFLRSLAGIALAARALYLVTVASCLLLATFNLYDYYRIRRGRP